MNIFLTNSANTLKKGNKIFFLDYKLLRVYKIDTVLTTAGENIIATSKTRNNYVAIQSFIFQYCYSNIGLFSIAPRKVITPTIA